MSETLMGGMPPEKADKSAMLRFIDWISVNGRASKGDENANDPRKPVTVRVRGDGVAYVDLMELMNSQTVQDQLAGFGKFFHEEQRKKGVK